MLRNYLIIAFRNLSKQKVLTGINILGLSIGLACFCLILLYAVNEFSYDKFHKDAKNIYRVYRWSQPMENMDAEGDAYLPMPLGPALKEDLPGIKHFVRMQEGWNESFVKSEDDVYRFPITFADPQFFSVFSFPLKSGSPTTALKDLHNVVLSEKTAQAIFGQTDPVGKTISLKIQDNFEPFLITGVAKKIPSNSSIDFAILCNYEFIAATKNGARSVNNWHRSSYITYLQLDPGSDLANDPKKLQDFYNSHNPDSEKEMRQRGLWKGEGSPVTYGLLPLLSVHTNTKFNAGTISNIDPKNIWILLGIATAVLLIACINFTTLAIGRSAGRAREVGIRKVIGSNKKSLVFQFVSESILLSIFSVLLGLLLGKMLLPYFNELSGRDLSFSLSQFPELIWLISGLTLIVGILAGSYPAMVLSGFNPIEALKHKTKVGGANIFTRSLVTLQFVLSIGLIASTSIMLQQIHYMTGKNPGFNKENIIVVNADDTDSRNIFPLFKEAVLAHPGIEGIAGSELGIGEGTGWSQSGFEYQGQHKEVYEYFVDKDFIPLMGMQLLAGRNFNPEISSDSIKSVIVNESMVSDFGWTIQNAVGQVLKGYYEGDESKSPVVIGVVKNFHYRPLKEEVAPQMFHQFADYTSYKYFIRIKAGDPTEVLSALQSDWKKIVVDLPFRFSFLDEDLDRFYKAESRWGKIIGWAGGISIFLACLGLFGLAALSAVNRTKEIGIRKILGASIGTLVGLLSKDYLKLVFLAILIATPLSWYFMYQWLSGFTYRIGIAWWVFLLAGLAALIIALITVSFQAIKAAIVNPVKSLRTE